MKLPIVGKESYGYLIDVIITRDVSMHRMDIARRRQGGRAHKGLRRTRHRRCGGRLGPTSRAPLHARSRRSSAGGSYMQEGSGEIEQHRLDAIEFCRILSGRGPGAGLFQRRVLF